ncbi:type 2 lanthipeptide synthetase LanM family protein [Haloarcula argentinensis]|nr:type 2 lanthipeptide synthetase LanM family protein [Haloarcula argentinensis]
MSDIFTEKERREIAGRARTLHERLNGPGNDPITEPPIEPDQMLREWKELFPDEESFQARLEREGFTESRVHEQMAATHWPANEPLPEWIFSVEALIEYIETNPDTDEEQISVPSDTPFRELLSPITRYACNQLPELTIPMEAVSPMVQNLISQLELLCTRALYVEFKSFVEYHDPELAAADPDEFTDPPTSYYEQFVDAMFKQGFRNLCIEYPVLVRQLVQIINQWINATDEVSRRIQTDRDALKSRFGISGDIISLEPLSDDAHNGGRLPVLVSFESGSVVYKPRSVDAGIRFYEILDRLKDYFSIPSIQTPKFCSRDGYGWMERIKYQDLPSEDATKRYYERAGAILCVAYVLNFTDIQLENLIVQGEHPMVVDGETIFHPHIGPDSWPVPTEIPAIVNDSVLSTALIRFSAGDPRKPDKEGFAASLAGLGRNSDRTKLSSRTRPIISAVNTDVMSVEIERVEVGLRTNTPSIGNTDQPPEEYIDAITQGFDEAYKTIQNLHADERFLTEIASPEIVRDVENRLVYRSTIQYVSILRSAVGRNPLQDGARLSLEFESLAVPFFDGQIGTDKYWPLYEAERQALRRLDVPRFSSRINQRKVFHDNSEVDVCVDNSGYENVRNRLDAMDATDRHRQIWLIQQSLDKSVPERSVPSSVEPTEKQLLLEAEGLFDKAIDVKIDTANSWVSITPDFSGTNLYPADHSLFWGRGGIALTAAALYDATGRDYYRQQVSDILSPTVESLFEGTLKCGLGGTRGIGSVIYVFSVVAELLDEEYYRKYAEKATHLVTENRLAADDTLDIMEGSAGTLLGLLAYYDRYGDSTVLDRAIACGDRLLEARTNIGGHQVWITSDDKYPLTGFSHGTSGIAYSLASLAAVTDDGRYAEATRDTIEFESELYDPSLVNWPKSTKSDKYVDRWCHGRSGMALTRIGIGEQLNDETLIDQAMSALSVTAKADPASLDNVCCGNAGRAEALLVGSRYTDINRSRALELAGRMLARRNDDGTLSLPGHSEWFVNPTFFDGVVGVAYTLLRARSSDTLPSVLLLE